MTMKRNVSNTGVIPSEVEGSRGSYLDGFAAGSSDSASLRSG
jgi:hypothetical protein